MIKKIKILFIVCSAQQIFFFLFKNLYLFAIKVPKYVKQGIEFLLKQFPSNALLFK